MTTGSTAAFGTAFERMLESRPHYWLVMVSDVVWALGFLVVGLRTSTGSALAGTLAAIAGFAGWGLIEYVTHRWILHGPPSLPKRSHARHHGNTEALISTPVFVIFGAALVIRAALTLVLAPGVATLAVFGLYAGYNYFSMLHHLQHRRRAAIARVEYWRRLVDGHDIHHHHALVNFGVTTTIWDRVFGTFEPRPREERGVTARL